MSRLPRTLLLLGLGLGPAVAWADPPDDTLARLEVAFETLGDPAQVAGYTATTVANHRKPSGKDAHEERVITRLTVAPDGSVSSEMVQSLTDGVPVSEAEREARRKERRGGEDDGGQMQLQLRGPVGEDRALYAWTEAVEEDGLLVASFAPAEGVEGIEGLGTGRLAWSTETRDPAWIEFELVDNPMFVDALHSRMDFVRQDELLYMERLVTEGRGGLPAMKRVFHMVITISGVEAR